MKGIGAASIPLGRRLAAINAEESAATETHTRELGDAAGTAYADAARVLVERFSAATVGTTRRALPPSSGSGRRYSSRSTTGCCPAQIEREMGSLDDDDSR